MKKLVLLVLLLLQGACSQENTAIPVATVSEPCQNPLPAGNEDIPRENAKPLANACVDDLFQRVAQACDAQDGQMLLAQITPEHHELILARKPESVSVFDRASYLCRDMAQIKEEILSDTPNPAYGIFRSRKSARLCVYSQDRERCEGELKVAFADERLKLNTH
jgi:hypothetical protein